MLITASSCGIFRKTQVAENEVIILEPVKKDTTITENPPQDTTEIVENTTQSETSKKKKTWGKKNTYNVAFILPFAMDAIELASLMGNENLSGYQPLASIEFYEGALLALDSLKAQGVNLHVSVFDNAKDDSATAALFNQPVMKTMDILIGPLFNQSLKIAAEFAREHEIFLISPLSPSQNITHDNRYYIMANATLKTQIGKSIAYFYASDPNANVIVVFRPDKLPEAKLGNEFTACFTNDSTLRGKTIKTASTAGSIGSQIRNGVKNYIFIASTDELYVNGLVRELSKMSRGSENINIVGMPGLLDLESIPVDYYEGLNFHFPTSYWVDPNAPRTERFHDLFESKYKCYPSEFAYRGYDITYYFGQMLNVFGPDIASNFSNTMLLKSPLYRFQFSPCLDEHNNIKYFENTNIIMLKYDNYRFEKVN